MTAIRLAHADPWPGRTPDGRMSVRQVLVVLADDAGPDYSCTIKDGRVILTAAVPEPAAFAFLMQEIYAEDYYDRTVTFRGDLRATGVADRAGLLLRVTTNRPAPRQPPDQDPANHFAPVTGTSDWTRHEATAQVPPDANYIFFGVFLNGRGQIELRNPQLEPHPASQEQQPRESRQR